MVHDMAAEISAELRAAERSGPVAPVSGRVTGGLDGAYAVQAASVAAWRRDGRRRAGYKIGMTSAAAQAQFGIKHPAYGVLFDDMRIADGAMCAARLFQPRIEGEIAVVIGRTPAPGASDAEIAAAIAELRPAIEIADCRIAGWKIGAVDFVADNAAAAHFVLGAPADPRGADTVGCSMTMRAGNEIIAQGTGAACMGGPYRALAWLAGALAERGTALEQGDVVMTGALGPPQPIAKGRTYAVEIGGLGAVSVAF